MVAENARHRRCSYLTTLANLSTCSYRARRGSSRSAEAVPLPQSYDKQDHAEFRPQHRAVSDNPKWLAYSDQLIEGLRKAGMPEE
jgi:hypothetical protein